MGKISKAIPLKILSEIIHIHQSTLTSWMCHYSLTKYFFQRFNEKGFSENMFIINNESIKALRKYLSHKRAKYLAYLDTNIDNIKNFYL